MALVFASTGAHPGAGQGQLRTQPKTSGDLFDGGDDRERLTPIREAGISVDDYLDGRWRLVDVARDNGARLIVLSLTDVPGHIAFGDGIVGYTECPQYDFAYRVDADSRLLKLRDEALADTRVNCPGLSRTTSTRGDAPVAWDAMLVLHGNPALAMLDMKAVILAKGPYLLVLERMTPPPSPVP